MANSCAGNAWQWDCQGGGGEGEGEGSEVFGHLPDDTESLVGHGVSGCGEALLSATVPVIVPTRRPPASQVTLGSGLTRVCPSFKMG